MTYSKDIEGKKFGKLTAIRKTDFRHHRSIVWVFLCDCGSTIERSPANVHCSMRRGLIPSCGCHLRGRYITHGKTKSPEYRAWADMRQRCYRSNNPAYPDYGGRGIAVCEEWDSFEQFYVDMGPRPTPKHSIDRIDVNGNYCKENCRWGTKTQQAINRRLQKNNTSGVCGVTKLKKNGKYRAQIKIQSTTICLGEFLYFEDAVAARLAAEKLYFFKFRQHSKN